MWQFVQQIFQNVPLTMLLWTLFYSKKKFTGTSEGFQHQKKKPEPEWEFEVFRKLARIVKTQKFCQNEKTGQHCSKIQTQVIIVYNLFLFSKAKGPELSSNHQSTMKDGWIVIKKRFSVAFQFTN
jgi:hypothetical protein